MPVLELDAGKNTTASYVYGANGVIYRRKHLPGGDEYEYHHVNALGSLAIITDDNESVVARYEYDAFGAVRHQWGDSDNIRKFTGKEYDADVKLYYYGARYYDPYIGRFISRDPAADGINWYVYCRNNPLSLVDPTGLEVIKTRGVTDTELEALIFTYGEENGNALALGIVVQIVTADELGRAAGKTTSKQDIIVIMLSEYYDDNSLSYLSVFIHESAHAWQRLTGEHRGGKPGEDYDYTVEQLQSLELNREEHAQAVTDWFYINWGLHRGKLGLVPWAGFYHNITYRNMRVRITRGKTRIWTVSSFARKVNEDYSEVINEIRTTLIPLVVGLPFPNPS